jgi:hypothetical protein
MDGRTDTHRQKFDHRRLLLDFQNKRNRQVIKFQNGIVKIVVKLQSSKCNISNKRFFYLKSAFLAFLSV